MNPKLSFLSKRKYFYGLLFFSAIILVTQLVFNYIRTVDSSEFEKINFIRSTENSVILSEFNPNNLDESQWKNLGFSEKQVKTILKYKEILGGNFSSKEQLKKCYAISDEKFSELESYILLPETSSSKESYPQSFQNFEKKDLKISGRFNPDSYSENDWQKMGFSEKQAAAIVKYKMYLGGSFVSKEKFKECFIISDENYKKLAPYLLLPNKTPENFQQNDRKFANEKPKIQYFEFNPNTLEKEGWQKLGFSEKQAEVIVNYRDKNLKGSFKSLEDIEKCFVINTEKFKELKPYIQLVTPENKVAVTPQKVSALKTDFAKTDLNKITFAQLSEFGFDEKSAASFIGFRNKLGGFINKNQILETYNIDKNIAEKLITVSPLNIANVQKFNLIDAPEDWLKNHPYFKYYANKIIYYRISYPTEKEVFKKLKAKPEDEIKMKLYLK